MCTLCGCREYISQGKEAVLRRAVELVQRLGLTAENASLFEDGEYICGILGPRIALSAEDADVWDTIQWDHRLHEEMFAEKHRRAAAAARDVFQQMPAKGKPKEVITLYHQLEQLSRAIPRDMLASLDDPSVRRALEAMEHVHDRGGERKAELMSLYDLS